jgi:hypothetical protein
MVSQEPDPVCYTYQAQVEKASPAGKTDFFAPVYPPESLRWQREFKLANFDAFHVMLIVSAFRRENLVNPLSIQKRRKSVYLSDINIFNWTISTK